MSAMSNRKTKTPVELASDFVSDTIDSAKAAFTPDSDAAKESIEALNQSAKVYQARFAELQTKGMDIAEANTKAFFAFWRDATTAKSPEALFTLQQDFVKAQSEATLKQLQDLNAVTVALVREAAAPVQAGFNKVLNGYSKAA
jgi:hypothetical protein